MIDKFVFNLQNLINRQSPLYSNNSFSHTLKNFTDYINIIFPRLIYASSGLSSHYSISFSEFSQKVTLNKLLQTNEENDLIIHSHSDEKIKKISDAANLANQFKGRPTLDKEKSMRYSYYEEPYDFLSFHYDKDTIISLLVNVIENYNRRNNHSFFLAENDVKDYSKTKTVSYLNSLYKTKTHPDAYSFNEVICIVSNLYFKYLHNEIKSKNTESYFNLVTQQPNPLEVEKIYNQLKSELKPKLSERKYKNYIYSFSELNDDNQYKMALNRSHKQMVTEINSFISYLKWPKELEAEVKLDIKDEFVKGYIKSILASYYHLNFLPAYEIYLDKLENINSTLINDYTRSNKVYNSIDFENIYRILDDCAEKIHIELTQYQNEEYKNERKTNLFVPNPIPRMSKKSNLSLIALQKVFQRHFLSNMNKNKLYYKERNKNLNVKKRKKVFLKNVTSDKNHSE